MKCEYCGKKKRFWHKEWFEAYAESVHVWFCSLEHRKWYMNDRFDKGIKYKNPRIP